MSAVFAQPGFAEAEHVARPDDRIFFAALPDAGAKAEMARRVSRVCGDRVMANGFDAARLHVSLCFLATGADLSPQIEQRARAAASAVRMRPFTAAFNCVARFSKGDGKRPLVLLGDEGVGGLTALQRSLGLAMREVGLGHREQPGFTPHVTLLYGTLPIEEQTIEPIRWTVRDFVLVQSHRGEGRHSYLGSWPLRV
jgi:RNA 2',3'-cyclic 3'-phosphodiesterase